MGRQNVLYIELITVTAKLIKILDILLEVRYWANEMKHVILE